MSITLSRDARSFARRPLLLGICIAICLVPGLIGGQFPPGSWYQELIKPALTPPGWVFPIAWITLYVMMGLSLFLFIGAPGRAPRLPLVLFGTQLALNALWSYLFFGLHLTGLAVIEIALLWLLILGSAIGFWRTRPAAGALLLPYLGWVSFAGYLTFELWRLNG